MSENVDSFLTRLLERLLDEAATFARPSIPSHTLQREMSRSVEYVVDGQGYGRLYIDQYWAIYLHDGRAAVSKAPLIWFKNPNDDPRLVYGYPATRYDEFVSFRFNPEDLKKWLKINRALIKSGVSERDLPMQVRWHGVSAITGSYFFDNDVGMRGFIPIANDIVESMFLEYLEMDLGTLLRTETDPAYARLP